MRQRAVFMFNASLFICDITVTLETSNSNIHNFQTFHISRRFWSNFLSLNHRNPCGKKNNNNNTDCHSSSWQFHLSLCRRINTKLRMKCFILVQNNRERERGDRRTDRETDGDTENDRERETSHEMPLLKCLVGQTVDLLHNRLPFSVTGWLR